MIAGFTIWLVALGAFAAGLLVARLRGAASRQALAERELMLDEFRQAYEQRARELHLLKDELHRALTRQTGTDS